MRNLDCVSEGKLEGTCTQGFAIAAGGLETVYLGKELTTASKVPDTVV